MVYLFFIIFGVRGVGFTKDKGQFHCPQCETGRAYKFKKVTRFFTLYFIPIIPLGKMGEYVECQTCKGTFIPNVLNHDPGAEEAAFLSEYEKAMKHSMVLMMLADGEIDAAEKDSVRSIINKFGHNDISAAELELFINEVKRNKEPVGNYLKRVAGQLNGHSKEVILQSALEVASADGNIDSTEMALLEEMATALEVSNAHLKGIVAEHRGY